MSKPRLIGIDGMDGSGKSTLALALSKEIDCLHINIDDYIDKNLGQYVSHVHYDVLRKQIDDAKGAIVLEGVCLLAVLNSLQRSQDILIYVKRVSHDGRWNDEDNCVITENIEEFLNKKKEDLQKFVWAEASIEEKKAPEDINFPKLEEEIIRYNYKYKSYEKADIIYKIIIEK